MRRSISPDVKPQTTIASSSSSSQPNVPRVSPNRKSPTSRPVGAVTATAKKTGPQLGGPPRFSQNKKPVHIDDFDDVDQLHAKFNKQKIAVRKHMISPNKRTQQPQHQHQQLVPWTAAETMSTTSSVISSTVPAGAAAVTTLSTPMTAQNPVQGGNPSPNTAQKLEMYRNQRRVASCISPEDDDDADRTDVAQQPPSYQQEGAQPEEPSTHDQFAGLMRQRDSIAELRAQLFESEGARLKLLERHKAASLELGSSNDLVAQLQLLLMEFRKRCADLEMAVTQGDREKKKSVARSASPDARLVAQGQRELKEATHEIERLRAREQALRQQLHEQTTTVSGTQNTGNAAANKNDVSKKIYNTASTATQCSDLRLPHQEMEQQQQSQLMSGPDVSDALSKTQLQQMDEVKHLCRQSRLEKLEELLLAKIIALSQLQERLADASAEADASSTLMKGLREQIEQLTLENRKMRLALSQETSTQDVRADAWNTPNDALNSWVEHKSEMSRERERSLSHSRSYHDRNEGLVIDEAEGRARVCLDALLGQRMDALEWLQGESARIDSIISQARTAAAAAPTQQQTVQDDFENL